MLAVPNFSARVWPCASLSVEVEFGSSEELLEALPAAIIAPGESGRSAAEGAGPAGEDGYGAANAGVASTNSKDRDAETIRRDAGRVKDNYLVWNFRSRITRKRSSEYQV